MTVIIKGAVLETAELTTLVNAATDLTYRVIEAFHAIRFERHSNQVPDTLLDRCYAGHLFGEKGHISWRWCSDSDWATALQNTTTIPVSSDNKSIESVGNGWFATPRMYIVTILSESPEWIDNLRLGSKWKTHPGYVDSQGNAISLQGTETSFYLWGTYLAKSDKKWFEERIGYPRKYPVPDDLNGKEKIGISAKVYHDPQGRPVAYRYLDLVTKEHLKKEGA